MHQSERSPSFEDIRIWLSSWLAEASGADEMDFTSSYLDAGLIDSMGLIDFIADIESMYWFTFSAREFQDERFVTIDGLAEIIHGKLHESGPQESA